MKRALTLHEVVKAGVTATHPEGLSFHPDEPNSDHMVMDAGSRNLKKDGDAFRVFVPAVGWEHSDDCQCQFCGG